MSGRPPSRGDLWLVNLIPTRGHEQAGVRPAVVVSVDQFNHGPAGLVVVLPLTTRFGGIPVHVPIEPPVGSIRQRSFIKREDVHSVAQERLVECWGIVSDRTMAAVADRLRILLGL
jgi:mRNA interferase MazF